MEAEPVSVPLPDELHRRQAALVMGQVARVCGVAVLGYRISDEGREEVQTEAGWQRVRDLLDSAGGKP